MVLQRIKWISFGLIKQRKNISLFEVNTWNFDNYSCRAMASNAEDSATCSHEITEGQARILIPKPEKVFYNPVQVYNRDITIAVLRQFIHSHRETLLKEQGKRAENIDSINSSGNIPATTTKKGLRVLEALSASGLRSVRFAKEVRGIEEIVANDLSYNAVEAIKRNVELNDVSHLVTPNISDASLFMYEHKKREKRFHVIDIDPYGTASPFLDAAVQAVADGGLLCVTCTDAAVLCGNGSETCYSKYGSMSLKMQSCHEMAIRIVLNAIESHANRYSRYIEPLVSLSIDFYIRVFVRVQSGQRTVKESASKRAHVFLCKGCETFSIQPVGIFLEKGTSKRYLPGAGPVVNTSCEHCGWTHEMGGPIWLGRIHNRDFVQGIITDLTDSSREDSELSSKDRIVGMLSLALEELPDVPLYYMMDKICKVIHVSVPKLIQFRSAILHAGYEISGTHANKQGFKTTAPMTVIWDILRCWERTYSPVSLQRRENDKNSPGMKILRQEPELDANFSVHSLAEPASRKEGLLRFAILPPNWGPKSRATMASKKNGDGDSEVTVTLEANEKSKRKQNKKRTVQEIDLKQYKCKKFRQGKCSRGDDCCYSHNSSKMET